MNDPVEDAVASLYNAFFNLRQKGELKEELEAMEALQDMLKEDIKFLKEKIKEIENV